jgi:hypothetical protein
MLFILDIESVVKRPEVKISRHGLIVFSLHSNLLSQLPSSKNNGAGIFEFEMLMAVPMLSTPLWFVMSGETQKLRRKIRLSYPGSEVKPT